MNTPAARDNQASITAISALRDHFRTLTTSMSPIAGDAGTERKAAPWNSLLANAAVLSANTKAGCESPTTTARNARCQLCTCGR